MKLALTFAFVLIIIFVKAQTCTGSLGDAIVNVTFGSGSQYGPPLSAGATSSLNYAPENCPPDGSYAITNYTSGCWASDVVWHTATDHTGNANGYFMLINASYQPSYFYIQTINGLCEGTTYRFAAWLLNMCSVTGTLPDITFTIEKTDGSILSTYNTGAIPIINPVTWKQYGFNFTTPANVSAVVLKMRNNAPGGVGNDVGLDDITFRAIGPNVTIASASFAGDSVSLCTDDNKTIEFESTIEDCYLSTACQWQLSMDNGTSWADIPGAVNKTYIRTPTTAGTYMYRLSVAQQNNIAVTTCRVSSMPLTVNVYKNDVRSINITATNTSVCQGDSVTFTAAVTSAGVNPFYQWQLNGKPAGANKPTYTSNTLAAGDVVNCVLISSLPCNTPATSNGISIIVNARTTAAISASICEGEAYSGHTTTGTYTDIFTSPNGCDSTRTLSLTVYPALESLTDTAICYGTGFNGLTSSGTYNFTFTSANGCDSVHTVILHVMPDINSKPVTDTILCTGDSIILSPGKFDTYLWQDGSVKKDFTVYKGGTYSVKVSNQCGSAAKQFIINERACDVVFPSAFTPGNDGRNDVFKILNAYNLTLYHCTIFNRWGQRIFTSADPHIGWNGFHNGQRADEGVYVWFCDYSRSGNPRVIHLKGTVTLLK